MKDICPYCGEELVSGGLRGYETMCEHAGDPNAEPKARPTLICPNIGCMAFGTVFWDVYEKSLFEIRSVRQDTKKMPSYLASSALANPGHYDHDGKWAPGFIVLTWDRDLERINLVQEDGDTCLFKTKKEADDFIKKLSSPSAIIDMKSGYTA